MVNVPIHNQDLVGAVLLLCHLRGNRHVVEDAESHGAVRFSVVSCNVYGGIIICSRQHDFNSRGYHATARKHGWHWWGREEMPSLIALPLEFQKRKRPRVSKEKEIKARNCCFNTRRPDDCNTVVHYTFHHRFRN